METNYFELFGVPTPEPAAEGGAEGGKDPEVTDPEAQSAETGAEGSEEPELPPEGGKEPEVTDPAQEGEPEQAQGKEEMTAEERRKNAGQRRQKERMEAEQRGRQAAEEEIFRKMALRDPVSGKTVSNMQEFQAYQQAKMAAKAERDLKEGKLSPEVLRDVLMASPEMQEILQSAKEAKEQAQTQDFTARREMELAEIRKLNPEIKTLNDIIQMPTGADFAELVRKGCSFLQAYKTANFDQIMQDSRRAGEQRARNAAMSQSHLQRTPASSQEPETVPQQVREMYRRFDPGISDEEIAKDYKKRK